MLSFNDLQKQEFDKINDLIPEVQDLFDEFISVKTLNTNLIDEFILEIQANIVGFEEYEIKQFQSNFTEYTEYKKIEHDNLEDGLLQLSLFHKEYPERTMFNFNVKSEFYRENVQKRFLKLIEDSNEYWNPIRDKNKITKLLANKQPIKTDIKTPIDIAEINKISSFITNTFMKTEISDWKVLENKSIEDWKQDYKTIYG